MHAWECHAILGMLVPALEPSKKNAQHAYHKNFFGHENPPHARFQHSVRARTADKKTPQVMHIKREQSASGCGRPRRTVRNRRKSSSPSSKSKFLGFFVIFSIPSPENRPKISEISFLKKASRIFLKWQKIPEAFFKINISLIFDRFSRCQAQKNSNFRDFISFTFWKAINDRFKQRTSFLKIAPLPGPSHRNRKIKDERKLKKIK